MKIIKCISLIIVFIFLLQVSSIFSQDCLEYPEIEGSECMFCVPDGWTIINSPDIVSSSGGWQGGGCSLDVSSDTPSGGSMSLFLSTGFGFHEGMSTTVSGLNTCRDYNFNLYWEIAESDCCCFSEGGVLLLILDGEEYIFEDAEEWELIQICFVPSGPTIEFSIQNIYDGPGMLVVDSVSCDDVAPVCCPLILEPEEESYTICPDNDLILEVSYFDEEGIVDIEWTSSPSDGIDFLDDPNALNPVFNFPFTNDFEGETYIFTIVIEDENCSREKDIELIVLPILVPEFDLFICEINEDYVLPSISLDGFTGSWTGNFDFEELAGTTQDYIFSLDSGQDNCIEDWTYVIFIEPAIELSFELKDTFCVLDQQDYRLPDESLERIEGMWDDFKFSPSELGEGDFIFTFTADEYEGCAFNYEYEISIIEAGILSFNIPNIFCNQNDSIFLPDTTLLGVSGIWESAFIDLNVETSNASIIFEPTNNNGCYNNFVFTYSVGQNILNTFSIPDTICRSLISIELDSTSNEGYIGVWYPHAISFDTIQSDSFQLNWTPIAGQSDCLSDTIITIHLIDNMAIEFDLPESLCINTGIYTLPNISSNGIAGSWIIPELNTDTLQPQMMDLIFRRDNSNCTEDFIWPIEITEQVIPEFDFQTSFCQNDEVFELPTISLNGIEGSWSESTINPSNINGSTILNFIPNNNSNTCYAEFEIEITIAASIEPVFDLPETLCNSETVFEFPIESLNGILGTWDFLTYIPESNIGEISFNNSFIPADLSCYLPISFTFDIIDFSMLSIDFQNPTACESNDGLISVIPSVQGFEYSIDGGLSWQSINMFLDLPSGYFEVLIRSIHDLTCTSTLAIDLISPSSAVISSIEVVDISTCFDNNGQITCFATGNNLQYSIDNGLTWQIENLFENLSPGDYTISVRSDASDLCSDSELFRILDFPETIILNIVASDITDCDSQNGSITINAEGLNLEYSIDNGNTWSINNYFENLAEGTYVIISRSANAIDCLDSETIEINTPIQPHIIDVLINEPSDCGLLDASLTISGIGTNLEYSIDNGVNWQINNNFENLGSGNYNIVVREIDSPGCSQNLVVFVPDGIVPQIISSIIQQPSQCFGSDAFVQVDVDLTDVEYSIDNGISWQSDNSFFNLPEGDYNIIIRNSDKTNCVSNFPFAIVYPPCPCNDLTFSFDLEMVDCLNPNSGSVVISEINGFLIADSYTVQWLNGTFGFINENLSEGWQVFSIEYDNNCLWNDSIYIESFEPTSFDLLGFDQDCEGLGSIEVVDIQGGSGEFLYSIDDINFQENSTFFNLSAQEYQVSVQDLFNCNEDRNVEIYDDSDLQLDLPAIYQIEQGESVFLNPLINEMTLDDFNWFPTTGILNSGELIAEVSPLETTEYTLTIYFGSCVETRSVLVEVNEKRTIYLGEIFTPNGDGNNDSFFVQTAPHINIEILSFRIYDRWGNLVFEKLGSSANDQALGWDGRSNDTEVVQGVYIYSINYAINGNALALFGSVTLVR